MTLSAIKAKPDIRLKDFDPSDSAVAGGDKAKAESETEDLRKRLDRLQEVLFADHRHGVLLVLQGMDTAGKDGVIRHVVAGVNPQGVSVASFKVPNAEELDHDFLWRIHAQTPRKGRITIFNRSHYEDVLIVRVHKLVPPNVWKRRFHAINEFERNLVEEGTILLKFFLHISRDEQRDRLRARVEDKSKHWKLSDADIHERTFWGDYMDAYEEAIAQTSTEWAPWYVVPSNHKWVRNYVVSRVLVGALEDLDLTYPPGPTDLEPFKV